MVIVADVYDLLALTTFGVPRHFQAAAHCGGNHSEESARGRAGSKGHEGECLEHRGDSGRSSPSFLL
uniref:Uncharacterized protein n=1 Tax=Arundo donax TaxID=35708 RepID=A0A0A9A9N8_ARUDO